MKIEMKHLPAINEALGIVLYPWQIDYLVQDIDIPYDLCPCLALKDNIGLRKNAEAEHEMNRSSPCRLRGRQTGRTLAYCIKLALSDREPVDFRNPIRYCDSPGNRVYANGTFLRMFMSTRYSLASVGFPVIGVLNVSTHNKYSIIRKEYGVLRSECNNVVHTKDGSFRKEYASVWKKR